MIQSHRDIITYLRGCDGAEAKRIKSTLPCHTVAGTFSTRSEAGLIALSGLACVDLDSTEDYDTVHLSVPREVWDCFWDIHGNHNDFEAWRKLIQFISLN